MANIIRLNHSSFLIDSRIKIFIDPYNVKTDEKADFIFITHPHFDHYSINDIKKLAKKDTVIITPNFESSRKFEQELIKLRPWQKKNFKDLEFTAIPSYNINKQYHPKTNGWLGYIIEVGGEKIYHAGDTDFIDEMKTLGKVDYALLPVSGSYTMNPSEAALATKSIKPKVAIPMHYGGIIGDSKDAQDFEKMCSCDVKII
ncbi:MAG: MBL fold metallo-hydrolase [Nanobdellota archaeon]